jgi:hypothetical protein
VNKLLTLIKIVVVLCALGLVAYGWRSQNIQGAMLMVAAMTLIAAVVVPQVDYDKDGD